MELKLVKLNSTKFCGVKCKQKNIVVIKLFSFQSLPQSHKIAKNAGIPWFLFAIKLSKSTRLSKSPRFMVTAVHLRHRCLTCKTICAWSAYTQL